MIRHFHHYLWGRHFELRTDHASLRWLNNYKNCDGMLARWLASLQEYDYSTVHRAGKLHTNADGLSRCHTCQNPSARGRTLTWWMATVHLIPKCSCGTPLCMNKNSSPFAFNLRISALNHQRKTQIQKRIPRLLLGKLTHSRNWTNGSNNRAGCPRSRKLTSLQPKSRMQGWPRYGTGYRTVINQLLLSWKLKVLRSRP